VESGDLEIGGDAEFAKQLIAGCSRPAMSVGAVLGGDHAVAHHQNSVGQSNCLIDVMWRSSRYT
jgi:hypothetical protein